MVDGERNCVDKCIDRFIVQNIRDYVKSKVSENLTLGPSAPR